MRDRPRIALVTGAGRNLGRAIAIALAREGADVAVNARANATEVNETAEEIRGLGRRAVPIIADVADPVAVAEMVTRVESELGPVGILVNNAGPRREQAFDTMSRADWDAVVTPVLTGAFHCSRAVIPEMRDQHWGRIINILGAIAHQGQPNRAHLAAAKAGLMGLTRALAVEFGPYGITVNAVSPAVLDTPPPPGLDPAVRARRAASKPVPRLGQPAEVAQLCAYLASDAAGFITGQSIGINGGEWMP